MPRKNDDAWMQSLDEYKVLQTYESQKKQGKNSFEKAERTVRGDWKPRQKGRGDWICPRHECGNINFGYRDECNLCSEPRPKSTFFNIKGRFVRPSDTGGEIGEEASTNLAGYFLPTIGSVAAEISTGRSEMLVTNVVDLASSLPRVWDPEWLIRKEKR